jgi:hypothetical protein
MKSWVLRPLKTTIFIEFNGVRQYKYVKFMTTPSRKKTSSTRDNRATDALSRLQICRNVSNQLVGCWGRHPWQHGRVWSLSMSIDTRPAVTQQPKTLDTIKAYSRIRLLQLLPTRGCSWPRLAPELLTSVCMMWMSVIKRSFCLLNRLTVVVSTLASYHQHKNRDRRGFMNRITQPKTACMGRD